MMPEATDVGGRQLGFCLAEMLLYYRMEKPSDKGFMKYADRMRTWHRVRSPRGRWKLIPRTKERLFDQTGFYRFEEGLWETLTYCPEKACGRAQSMDGSDDVGSNCRFCNAALRNGSGKYASQSAHMRMQALAVWIANDDILPAHIAHAPVVQDALLSRHADAGSIFETLGARAQLHAGGDAAEIKIARNPLCFKGTLSFDDKQMINTHGRRGPVSLGATQFLVKSLPPRLLKAMSATHLLKFLIRIQMTAGPVNMQEQYLKIVQGLHPYTTYTVRALFSVTRHAAVLTPRPPPHRYQSETRQHIGLWWRPA
jgi:hypothetical protein